jgi:hypothetical protein
MLKQQNKYQPTVIPYNKLDNITSKQFLASFITLNNGKIKIHNRHIKSLDDGFIMVFDVNTKDKVSFPLFLLDKISFTLQPIQKLNANNKTAQKNNAQAKYLKSCEYPGCGDSSISTHCCNSNPNTCGNNYHCSSESNTCICIADNSLSQSALGDFASEYSKSLKSNSRVTSSSLPKKYSWLIRCFIKK